MSPSGEHAHGDRDETVVVQIPEHPPTVKPPAARALLRLLRKASGNPQEDNAGHDEEWRDAA